MLLSAVFGQLSDGRKGLVVAASIHAAQQDPELLLEQQMSRVVCYCYLPSGSGYLADATNLVVVTAPTDQD